MEDLWPDDFGNIKVAPPILILRAQAGGLTKKTRGEVEGRVVTNRLKSDISHVFQIIAPALDGYTYNLFEVVHPIELYPLRVFVDPGRDSTSAPMNTTLSPPCGKSYQAPVPKG